MSVTCDEMLLLLDRHLDGELPGVDRMRLEEHLRTCPSCAIEALRRRELEVAIREAGRAFEPPPALETAVRSRLRREAVAAPRASRRWLLPLAAVLVIGIAVAAIRVGAGAARQGRLLAQVVDLHVLALGEASRLDVLSSDAHTVKPWFEGKLPFAFDLPELAGTGWELAGGRLVSVDGAPSAQLVLGIRRHRVSVLVLGGPAGPGGGLSTGLDREASRGFRLLSWTANGLRYVAVSDTGAGDLETLRELFRRASRS